MLLTYLWLSQGFQHPSPRECCVSFLVGMCCVLSTKSVKNTPLRETLYAEIQWPHQKWSQLASSLWQTRWNVV